VAPALQPGEWRTLGLFAADDADQLQQTLASMPLKIWRTDQVTPLAPHPNDPGPSTRPGQAGAELLTTFTITIPDGTPGQAVEGAEAGKAARAHGLAGQGHLERLWILPGQGRALGVYRARDSAQMEGDRHRVRELRCRRSHREVPAARPVDDDEAHAAHAAPERSRDHKHMSTNT
jgi:muconolactone delta-isomerase